MSSLLGPSRGDEGSSAEDLIAATPDRFAIQMDGGAASAKWSDQLSIEHIAFRSPSVGARVAESLVAATSRREAGSAPRHQTFPHS
mgnify:CR=1 FL=1